LCCGSAGTYNILEPEIAARLRDRKFANIAQTSSDLVATGNIGCIAQIASGTSIPVLHTTELLDFAHGGPTRMASRAVRLNVISAARPLARQLSPRRTPATLRKLGFKRESGDGMTVLAFALCGISPNNSTSKQLAKTVTI
jgi:Cysteine-rich domain